jgi:hypothetical protein
MRRLEQAAVKQAKCSSAPGCMRGCFGCAHVCLIDRMHQ